MLSGKTLTPPPELLSASEKTDVRFLLGALRCEGSPNTDAQLSPVSPGAKEELETAWEYKLAAANALLLLATRQKDQVMREKPLEVLGPLLKDGTTLERENGIFVICGLVCVSREAAAQLESSGLLDPIVEMLKSNTTSVTAKQGCLRVISRLVAVSEGCAHSVMEQALEKVLINIMKSRQFPPQAVKAASECLLALSMYPQPRTHVASSLGVPNRLTAINTELEILNKDAGLNVYHKFPKHCLAFGQQEGSQEAIAGYSAPSKDWGQVHREFVQWVQSKPVEALNATLLEIYQSWDISPAAGKLAQDGEMCWLVSWANLRLLLERAAGVDLDGVRLLEAELGRTPAGTEIGWHDIQRCFREAFEEEPPAEEPPAEEPPAEEPPAEEPPAEEPPAEEPPAEEPPAKEPPAKEPPAEEPPAQEPPAEEPPAKEPPECEHAVVALRSSITLERRVTAAQVIPLLDGTWRFLHQDEHGSFSYGLRIEAADVGSETWRLSGEAVGDELHEWDFQLEQGLVWLDPVTTHLHVRLRELWKMSSLQRDAAVVHEMVLVRANGSLLHKLVSVDGSSAHRGIRVDQASPGEPAEYYGNSLDHGARNCYLEACKEQGDKEAPPTPMQVLRESRKEERFQASWFRGSDTAMERSSPEEPAAEEAAAPPLPMDGKTEVDVVVGFRVVDAEGQSTMNKLKLHCMPSTKVSNILKAANTALARLEGVEMAVERLVPLWTPTWDALPVDGVMIDVLTNSVDQSGQPYDAREMDPVRMVGVDSEQFDASFWNEHLDFLHEEFVWLEAVDVQEDAQEPAPEAQEPAPEAQEPAPEAEEPAPEAAPADTDQLSALTEKALAKYNQTYGSKEACGAIGSLEELNARGATALFCAVKYGEDPAAESYKSDCRGDVETVGMLLEARADVHARGEGNSTALHEAAWKGHLENVQALLGAGSDVNAELSWKRRQVTPLQKAAEGSRNESFVGRDWEAVIGLLKEHGGECRDPMCAVPFSDAE